MIARAPSHAREVTGIVLLVAGPERGVIRWSGWSEVWLHPDGRTRVAFPKMSSIRDARHPTTKMLWIKIVKNTERSTT